MPSLIVYVIDTETVGKDPGPERVVELGVAPLVVPDVDSPCDAVVVEDEIFESYVRPGERISFGAMATHGIREETVASAPSLDEVLRASPLIRDGRSPSVIAAHNAPFDKSFLDESVLKYVGSGAPYWLDTLRCAKHVLPDVEGYGNQSLRYELDLRHPCLEEGGAHRAGSDALVTALLLARMLRETSLRELCRLQGQPVLMKSMTYGKHRGQLFEDLPVDYLRWMLRSDLDEDAKHSARTELARRAGAQAA